MRILQLHNKVPYPPKDGGSIGVWNYTEEFARQGHDVTLLLMNTTKHYCVIEDIPQKITDAIRFITVDVDTPITGTGALSNLLFSKKPYNAQRFILKSYKDKLQELLSKEEFDVIQLEGLYLCPYIPIIRKFSNALISFKAHNVEHEIWNRVLANEPSAIKKNYLRILSKRIMRMEIDVMNKYDVLVTFTERDARLFNTIGNKKPYLVSPIGIDTSHLMPERKNINYPSVFYIGALDWAPNQEGLMWFVRKVWSNLQNKFPDLKLEVAGRNAPDWIVKSLDDPSIVFHGEIDDAYKFINNHAIMIVPLLSGSGMRIKIVEGMALGKTIVTTSIGNEGIDTTHNVDILIADTADQFQKQIERALTDRQFFDSIGLNAIKYVKQNFDINNITKTLIGFWSKRIH